MATESIIIIDRYGNISRPKARIGTKARARIEKAIKLLNEAELAQKVNADGILYRDGPVKITEEDVDIAVEEARDPPVVVQKVLENYRDGLIGAEELATFALLELAEDAR